MKKIFTVALCAAYFLCSAQQMGEAMGYSPKYLSGSFAELRPSHFHSGIDYKTGGVTGRPVYAVEDGYVSRIAVSTGGYGKALYLSHPNGKTSVYAHLDSFSGEINTYVRRQQYSKESFTVSLFPERDRLPVKKGQLIGLSGNTGSSGGPHLHFEIRDSKTERPENPFLYGYSITDNIAPIINGLYYLDIDEDESVYEFREPKQLYFEKGSNKARLRAGGKIGFLVRAYDKLTGSDNLCGIYMLQMFVNDELYYEMKMDGFSFDESKLIDLHILYEYFVTHNSRIQKLYKEPENKLSIYSKTGKDGVLDIETGKEYNIKIVAADFAGNKTGVEVELTGTQGKAEEKSIQEGSSYLFSKNIKNSIDVKGFTAEVPKGALYKNYHMPFKEAAGGKYYFGDKRIPLAKSYTLCLDASSVDANVRGKAGIVLYDEREPDKYSFMGGKVDSLSRICVRCSSFGLFGIETDTAAPTVAANVSPAKALTSSTINITIKDETSGIATYNCYIDGKWVLAEYNVKTSRLGINLDNENIGKGRHKLRVAVKDRVGNAAEKDFEFVR